MGAVLVHIDRDGDRPDGSSMLALAAGRAIASSWGATLYAAIVHQAPTGSDAHVGLEALQAAVARGGADRFVIVATDALVAPLWASVGHAWETALDELRPRLVLFGADAPSAAELGPRTGARIGARMLLRARVRGGDLVELRERDGGYVRATDGGAAVALIGAASPVHASDEPIEHLVLRANGRPDATVELVSTLPAELAHTGGALVVLGDDLVDDAAAVAAARHLADLLGAHLAGTTNAVRAGLVPPGAIVDARTPLAPELCVALGTAGLDLAGASNLIRIAQTAGKNNDGALVGEVAENVQALAHALETA